MVKILLVEDNEMNRDMLSRRLIKRNYQIVSALNGIQAIEMANEENPDLILMDLSLPILDGWEATRRIKASSKLNHIPIIALTAHVMSDDRDKALAAGCDDYATKPIDMDELIKKIEGLLAKK
jgi:CheY-like chemotaxis protein